MKPKTPSVKKKASAKAAAAPRKAAVKTPTKVQAKAPAKAQPQASWANTMKKALENKRSGGGWPDQPKPRDSTVQKVRKNAF
jgi:hypothetical protein